MNKKVKDYTISWKEITPNGVKCKSFDTFKSAVGWHMQNLKAAEPVCFDAKYTPKVS